MATRLPPLDHDYDINVQDPRFSIILQHPTDLETVLRKLFDGINMGEGGLDYSCSGTRNHYFGSIMSGGLGIKIVQGPSSDLVSVEFSDILTALVNRLCGHDNDYKHIQKLVCTILNEKLVNLKTKSSDGNACKQGVGTTRNEPSCLDTVAVSKKHQGPLPNLLKRLKEIATCPCAHAGDSECCRLVLNSRRILFLPAEQRMNREEYSYMEKQTVSPYLPDTARNAPSIFLPSKFSSGKKVGNRMESQPKRRSKRVLGQLKLDEGHLPRKRIPIGTYFQADSPKWVDQTSLYNYRKSTDPKWLGTQIWPNDVCTTKVSKELVGQGRPMCSCSSPRSVSCIKYHLRIARQRLQCELGQAFYAMGFDSMGEDVAKSWSSNEQSNFENLVRTNPISEGKTFLYPALRFFRSKSRQVIVSYYYNVYALRRMSCKTRMLEIDVDSDDDEDDCK